MPCAHLAAQSASDDVGRWIEIGPTSLGGRVSALAVNPQDDNDLLAGTPAGGLWRSADGAHTWRSVAPWLASTPISALGISPADSNVLIAGTGVVTNAGSVSGAIGVIRSNDGGLSWSLQTDPGLRPYISSILIWSDNPARVLAATDVGIQLSHDGGASFSVPLRGDAISVLARDPFDQAGIYASGRTGLFFSADRGETWSRRSAWPLLATDVFGAATATLAASARTQGLVLVSLQVLKDLNQTDRGMLLSSTDGGITFSEITTAPAFCSTPGSCGFAQALAIDPADDRRLLLAGEGVFTTADGGATWIRMQTLNGIHAVASTQPGLVAIGTSGVSIFDSTWSTVDSRNDGLAVTSVVDLDLSPEVTPRLLATTADSGTVLGVGSTPVWRAIFGPNQPAGRARWDRFVADRLYAGLKAGRLFRSDDAGSTFTAIEDGIDFNQSVLDPAPFEVNPIVPGTLYTGRLQLFRSTDSGHLWNAIRPLGFPEISRLAPSPVDTDRLYFSIANSPDLYKADGIYTYRLRITDRSNLRVTSIFLDPAAENVLYVTMADAAEQKGRVYKSWNFGEGWDDITPAALASANAIVKDQFGVLYVGAANGVWRSPNDGATWAPFNKGLFAAGVNTLRIGDGQLFAGTDGRGVFRVPVEQLVQIDSIPPGMPLIVDGIVTTAPYYGRWAAGTNHTVRPFIQQTDTARFEFVSWSDGESEEHNVAGVGTNQFLTVAIRQSLRLTTAVEPAPGGTLEIDSPTSDSFQVLNSFAMAVATPAPEYRFSGFTGDQSGSDGVLAFAVMDRARSITAHFEPLRMQVKSEPTNLTLTVDGHAIAAPVTYQWAADSSHQVTAPELIALSAGSVERLAFDGWTDLLERDHQIKMTRDTFVTDLTAHFIRTMPSLPLEPLTAGVLKTEGLRDAPRAVGLIATGRSGATPPATQIVRSRIEGQYLHELALAPTVAITQLDVVVEGTPSRAVRLALFNRATEAAHISLVLRTPDGGGLLALADVLTVAPGANVVRWLSDFALLPPQYEGMLTVLSTVPVAVSVQMVGENLRPTTFIDPALLVPFTVADRGVPLSASTQPLALTASTVHRLALLNPSSVAISGSVELRDESGDLVEARDGTVTASRFDYSIPPGGHRVLRLEMAAGTGSTLATARAVAIPAPGQPRPLIQATEDATAGSSQLGPILIPRSLPPSRNSTDFLAPVDFQSRDSGFVVINAAAGPVDLTLTLRGAAGSVEGVAVVTLAAGSQRAFFARTLFPAAASDFHGVLEGTTPTAVGVIGVLRSTSSRGDDIIAGFPALDPAPASTLVFPYGIDGDSYSSEWWFLNRAAAADQVDLEFRGEQGETRYLPIQ